MSTARVEDNFEIHCGRTHSDAAPVGALDVHGAADPLQRHLLPRELQGDYLADGRVALFLATQLLCAAAARGFAGSYSCKKLCQWFTRCIRGGNRGSWCQCTWKGCRWRQYRQRGGLGNFNQRLASTFQRGCCHWSKPFPASAAMVIPQRTPDCKHPGQSKCQCNCNACSPAQYPRGHRANELLLSARFQIGLWNRLSRWPSLPGVTLLRVEGRALADRVFGFRPAILRLGPPLAEAVHEQPLAEKDRRTRQKARYHWAQFDLEAQHGRNRPTSTRERCVYLVRVPRADAQWTGIWRGAG
mmetsp:Transcript_57271/g.153328  ORF Transcript_57271/g.153328 Transcript_57271/m.153328 type:complete len:300 (+) Transcript_57271:1293-2192(+)